MAINAQETYEKADAWRKKENIAFPVLLDRSGETLAAYGVRSMPTVFVIGRDGRIAGTAIGTKPWTSPRGRSFIESLLAKT